MNDETMTEAPEAGEAALVDATTIDTAIPVTAITDPKLPPYSGE
jgi:hypothetical protein